MIRYIEFWTKILPRYTYRYYYLVCLVDCVNRGNGLHRRNVTSTFKSKFTNIAHLNRQRNRGYPTEKENESLFNVKSRIRFEPVGGRVFDRKTVENRRCVRLANKTRSTWTVYIVRTNVISVGIMYNVHVYTYRNVNCIVIATGQVCSAPWFRVYKRFAGLRVFFSISKQVDNTRLVGSWNPKPLHRKKKYARRIQRENKIKHKTLLQNTHGHRGYPTASISVKTSTLSDCSLRKLIGEDMRLLLFVDFHTFLKFLLLLLLTANIAKF